MRKREFPGGVWPVMLTLFTEDNKIDYGAMEQLIEWYISKGVDGLFAVCQSSEMFYLSDEESLELAKFVKEKVNNRIPVIASGNTASNLNDHIFQVNEMAKTGVDAVILITNRFAQENEGDEVFLNNIYSLLNQIPEHIPLGFYECPYPYKRTISPEVLDEIVKTERFYFLKDTCCDMSEINEKLKVSKDSNLKIYNANTATLLESLNSGVDGYSGVMANFHPDLYVWLTNNFNKNKELASKLQNVLSMCALIELQNYPKNAKYNLQFEGINCNILTRVKQNQSLTNTQKLEIRQLFDHLKDFREVLF